jgi:hypothetical protein
MAEFHRLPSRIQETTRSHLTEAEQVQMCALGRSELLNPDYVIVTSNRVLVLDERQIGSLSVSYINVRCNLPFSQITGITLDRNLKHRVLGQADIEIKVNNDKYLITNVSHREAKRVMALISSYVEARRFDGKYPGINRRGE